MIKYNEKFLRIQNKILKISYTTKYIEMYYNGINNAIFLLYIHFPF